VQVRHRLPVTVAGAGAVFLLTLATSLPFAAGAGADGDCDAAYDVYSSVSAAAGMQLTTTPSVFLPVNDADAGLPTAQSHVGSLSGSQAFAGVPYSEAAAGNLGVAGNSLGHPLTPNDVPVFSVSKYPSDKHNEKRDNPGYALSTTAAAQKATAEATAGAPPWGTASAGRTEVTSTTECQSGAVLHAVADNDVDVVDVAGTLRISNVRSHAEAVLGPTGDPVLTGSMQVEGASVQGQQVAITDKGIAVAGTTTPLPDSSPLNQALEQAGIGVRYVAAAKDAKKGSVVAPGLEITVTAPLPAGVGTGTIVTRITLGQAFAAVSRSGDVPAPATDDGPPVTSVDVPPATGTVAPPPVVSLPPPDASGQVTPPAPVTASGGSPSAPRLLRRDFRPWSIERVYVALVLAMGVLLIPRAGFKKVAVRLR
jgi:hypothetical protein